MLKIFVLFNKCLGVLLCMLIFYFFMLGVQDGLAKDEPSYAEQVALSKAQEKLEQNNPNKCLEILNNYKEGSTEISSYSFYLLLGNAYYRLDKMDRAKSAYAKGLEINPENENLVLNYALVCFSQQEYLEAGKFFDKAYRVKKDPEFELLYRAGVAFYHAKQYEKSKEVLQRLVSEADDLQIEWIELLTFSYLALKEWENAKDTLEKLLNQTPDKPKYWKMLARLYLKKQDYENAANSLKIAYCLKEPTKDEWKELADIYLYINAPLRAVWALHKAYGNNLTVEQCKKISSLYKLAFRFEQALNYINKAIKKDPSAELYLEKGKLLYQDQKFSNAVQALQKSIKLNSKQGQAYLLLGYAAWQIKDWQLAQSAFEQTTQFSDYSQSAQEGLEAINSILQAKETIEQS